MHCYSENLLRTTNKLTFSNDITSSFDWLFQRIYLTFAAAVVVGSGFEFEFEYMRRRPDPAFIYETSCKVDICIQGSVFL